MSFPTHYKSTLLSALETIDLSKVDAAIEVLGRARDEGRRIFVCGNGGSAASANHFACDVVKGCSYGRAKRFRIMALSEQIATMTAYANDVGYEHVFAEQLRNFACPGDVMMTLSGSGNSPNIVRVLETAKELDCYTIALTGRDGGRAAPLADLNIHVADDHMGRIEDGHMIVCHMLAYHFMDTEASDEITDSKKT